MLCKLIDVIEEYSQEKIISFQVNKIERGKKFFFEFNIVFDQERIITISLMGFYDLREAKQFAENVVDSVNMGDGMILNSITRYIDCDVIQKIDKNDIEGFLVREKGNYKIIYHNDLLTAPTQEYEVGKDHKLALELKKQLLMNEDVFLGTHFENTRNEMLKNISEEFLEEVFQDEDISFINKIILMDEVIAAVQIRQQFELTEEEVEKLEVVVNNKSIVNKLLETDKEFTERKKIFDFVGKLNKVKRWLVNNNKDRKINITLMTKLVKLIKSQDRLFELLRDEEGKVYLTVERDLISGRNKIDKNVEIALLNFVIEIFENKEDVEIVKVNPLMDSRQYFKARKGIPIQYILDNEVIYGANKDPEVEKLFEELGLNKDSFREPEKILEKVRTAAHRYIIDSKFRELYGIYFNKVNYKEKRIYDTSPFNYKEDSMYKWIVEKLLRMPDMSSLSRSKQVMAEKIAGLYIAYYYFHIYRVWVLNTANKVARSKKRSKYYINGIESAQLT